MPANCGLVRRPANSKGRPLWHRSRQSRGAPKTPGLPSRRCTVERMAAIPVESPELIESLRSRVFPKNCPPVSLVGRYHRRFCILLHPVSNWSCRTWAGPGKAMPSHGTIHMNSASDLPVISDQTSLDSSIRVRHENGSNGSERRLRMTRQHRRPRWMEIR